MATVTLSSIVQALRPPGTFLFVRHRGCCTWAWRCRQSCNRRSARLRRARHTVPPSLCPFSIEWSTVAGRVNFCVHVSKYAGWSKYSPRVRCASLKCLAVNVEPNRLSQLRSRDCSLASCDGFVVCSAMVVEYTSRVRSEAGMAPQRSEAQAHARM